MKSPKTFLLLSVIVAVLLLGVAYAAIQNITLTVTGNVVASPDQANFDVKFTGTPAVTGDGSGTLTISSATPTTATLSVSGLTKAGDTAIATVTVSNLSETLAATLADSASDVSETLTKEGGVTVTSTNEYFEVTTGLGTTSLTAASADATTDETVLTITIKLIKTPVEGDVEGTFTVSVLASPVN